MAVFLQIPFRVRRMATNGFNACRYSQKYGLDVDKDFKPVQAQGLAQLLAFFEHLFPELGDKQKYQLVFAGNFFLLLLSFFFWFYIFLFTDAGSGDNLLLENNEDLDTIIYLNKKGVKSGKFILLHILENSQQPATSTDKTVKQLNCRECGEGITGSLFNCSQCADYYLCGSCVTLGKHGQHAVIRKSKVWMG